MYKKKLLKKLRDYLKKQQKGGTILGKGRDGLVVEPAKLCSSNMIPDNKVSKLIDITEADSYEIENFIKEYKLGGIFRKYDKKNQYFLPGIDLCRITSQDADISQSLFEDIQNGYEDYDYINDKVELLNIVMKKGQDFKKITTTLSNKDLFKSIYYLIGGAHKCVFELNILLCDIKELNLLYSSDDNSKDIYPVFIDFSQDFVIRTIKEFMDFLSRYGRNTNYIWPDEVNLLSIMMNDNNYKKQILKGLKTNNSDYSSSEGKKKFNDIINYIENRISLPKGELFIYEKIMVYLIGMSYRRCLNEKQKNSKSVNKLLNAMTNLNIIERPTFKQVKDYIDKLYKFNNSRESVLINKKSLIGKFVRKIGNFKNKKTLSKDLKSFKISSIRPKF